MGDAHRAGHRVPVIPTLLDKPAGYGLNPIVGLANAAMTLRRSKTVASVGAFDSSFLSERRFVEAGKAAAPSCEHGMWTFAGSDAKRGAAKYRWPLGRVLLGERVDQG